MESDNDITSVLAGIMKRPWEWKQLMPLFLKKLSECSDEERNRILGDLAGAAIDGLSEDEYQNFVEEILVSLISMSAEVRRAILTSSIVIPKGLSAEKAAKARSAIVNMLKKNIIENSSNRDGIIRTVFESILLMSSEDAADVVSGIVDSSIGLGAMDYIKYTSAWLSVLGSMDEDSIRKILALRDNALKGFPNMELERSSTLLKASLFLIDSGKRKRILNALSHSE